MQNKSTIIYLLLLFITGVLIVGCSNEKVDNAAEYKKIDAKEAKKIIDAGGVTILDVRTEPEFLEGHIPNAILLPDTDIKEKAENVLPDKNSKILVYCRTGRRSALAAKDLSKMGYVNVYDFGGIVDWPYQQIVN